MFYLEENLWVIGLAFVLKRLFSTKIKIIVKKENIINDKKFFIAASHQSMFETFYLQTIFNSPSICIKKRTIAYSYFWLVFKKNWLYINYKEIKLQKIILSFFNEIKNIIFKTDRPLIIFPQGTRV